jgi:hypothetical protein
VNTVSPLGCWCCTAYVRTMGSSSHSWNGSPLGSHATSAPLPASPASTSPFSTWDSIRPVQFNRELNWVCKVQKEVERTASCCTRNLVVDESACAACASATASACTRHTPSGAQQHHTGGR